MWALNIPIDPGRASIMWDSEIINRVRDKDGRNTQRSQRWKANGNGGKGKEERSNVYLLGALMRDRSVVLISIVGAEVCAVFEHKPQKHQSVLINIWCGPLCTQGSRVAAIGPFCSLIRLSRLSKPRAFSVLQAASLKPRLAKLATHKVGRGRDTA